MVWNGAVRLPLPPRWAAAETKRASADDAVDAVAVLVDPRGAAGRRRAARSGRSVVGFPCTRRHSQPSARLAVDVDPLVGRAADGLGEARAHRARGQRRRRVADAGGVLERRRAVLGAVVVAEAAVLGGLVLAGRLVEEALVELAVAVVVEGVADLGVVAGDVAGAPVGPAAPLAHVSKPPQVSKVQVRVAPSVAALQVQVPVAGAHWAAPPSMARRRSRPGSPAP